MNTLSQWLQQHDFLLLLSLPLVGSAILISWLRRWTRRALATWMGLLLLAVASVIALRTPYVSVSVAPKSIASQGDTPDDLAETASPGYEELSLTSVEAIRNFIESGRKPTLVEIYSDYGLG
jgi:hypothetical protein